MRLCPGQKHHLTLTRETASRIPSCKTLLPLLAMVRVTNGSKRNMFNRTSIFPTIQAYLTNTAAYKNYLRGWHCGMVHWVTNYAGSVPLRHLLNSSLSMHLGKHQKATQMLGPMDLPGSPEEAQPRLLASAWLSPGHYIQSGHADRKTSLSLFPLPLTPSFSISTLCLTLPFK